TSRGLTCCAVTEASSGQDTGQPPGSAIPFRPSPWGPCSMTKPATRSKLSNSAWAAATSGKSQPLGGGTADAPTAVEGPAALEKAAEGPHRGERGEALFLERRVERLGPEGTEVAGLAEFAAEVQDAVLQDAVGASGPVGGMRAVVPIDPIQTLALRRAAP